MSLWQRKPRFRETNHHPSSPARTDSWLRLRHPATWSCWLRRGSRPVNAQAVRIGSKNNYCICLLDEQTLEHIGTGCFALVLVVLSVQTICICIVCFSGCSSYGLEPRFPSFAWGRILNRFHSSALPEETFVWYSKCSPDLSIYTRWTSHGSRWQGPLDDHFPGQTGGEVHFHDS